MDRQNIQDLLQQRADAMARLNLMPYDGSPEVKEQNSKRYLYVRKRIASRLTSTYVDVYSDELYQLLLRNAREARELRKQIAELPQKYAEVIFLHYYEGYTIKEIADITGKNENTVGSLLRRGREKLKAELEKEDESCREAIIKTL